MPPKSIAAILLLGTFATAAELSVPGFDASRTSFSQTSEQDLGSGEGDFSLTQFDLQTFLCNPLRPIDQWAVLPMAQYELTAWDLQGTPTTSPLRDDDFHAISFSTLLISMPETSPWIYGGWARAQISSDFQHVDGDDFTFDLAAGGGYRFNDHFLVAVGGTVINLNGDPEIYPGLNFDWIVNQQLRIGQYGPSFIADWAPHENWLLSLRGDPAGGLWNLTDDAGDSRTLDLFAYRVGVFVSRRLHDQLWLAVGGGCTVGNDLNYTTPGGRDLFSRNPDEGWFGALSLRMKVW